MTRKIQKFFKTSRGKKVEVRTVGWDDLDGLVMLFNSFTDEKMYVGIKEVTLEEEAEKLSKILVGIVKKELFYLVAEADGKIVGVAHVERDTSPTIEHSGHCGELGIRLMKGYRGMGIGTELIKVLFDLCKNIGMKLIVLATAATNTSALHLYGKLGFKEYGVICSWHQA